MSILSHRFGRVAGRSLWLAVELAVAVARFAALVLAQAAMPDRAARARWLQQLCRRALPALGVELRLVGPIPSRGLLVSNHLSYLDILLLSATAPCVFVSKGEVRSWPVFGWLATLAGTLYLHREKRSDVARVAGTIRRALDDGALVVLFPEGTTSDGRSVLPFKSSLLEPATRSAHALTAAHIGYALPDGSVPDEVCYWRDMTLGPHLLNLLGKRRLKAEVRFTEVRHASADRKELACQLRAEVQRLQRSFARGPTDVRHPEPQTVPWIAAARRRFGFTRWTLQSASLRWPRSELDEAKPKWRRAAPVQGGAGPLSTADR